MSVLNLKILASFSKNTSLNSYHLFNLGIDLEAVSMNYLANQWKVLIHFSKRSYNVKDD